MGIVGSGAMLPAAGNTPGWWEGILPWCWTAGAVVGVAVVENGVAIGFVGVGGTGCGVVGTSVVGVVGVVSGGDDVDNQTSDLFRCGSSSVIAPADTPS